MASIRVAPHGLWQSPISAAMAASKAIRLGDIAIDGEDIYWSEMRPTENGRHVVVKRTPNGRISDVTPLPFSARTRVHEYGGAAFAVSNGTVWFSNDDDQRLYRQAPGTAPRPITPKGDRRYAEGAIDGRRKRMICVCEDHTAAGREAINQLVSIDLEGVEEVRVLASGMDFYASPRISQDGNWLAWLAWNHPNMPWDGTELWVGKIGPDGFLEQPEQVSGGAEESVYQPEWSPNGDLFFISDRTGWWNLYRWRGGLVEPLWDIPAEFGRPRFVLGTSAYAFESPHRVVCTYTQKGIWRLASIDLNTSHAEQIQTPYTEFAYLRATRGSAVFCAGSPTQPMAIVQLRLSDGQIEVIQQSDSAAVDGYLSTPELIEFPNEKNQTAYAFFYSPKNRDFDPPDGERPPLLVNCHGGPTACAQATLDMAIQFWTSRGFAVLDVNYRGSTGFGRAYRQRLRGQWGIADVMDCICGARYLVERGAVDGDRLAIRGGSAGGYTTLCALVFHDFFKTGASYYGISDLELMRQQTHKFESRYLDGLVGPYPERRDIFQARSPIFFCDRLARPVIFFQGLEDRIVPPNQAERMVEALKAKGLSVAYYSFRGEQHGFRRQETIQHTLENELSFYAEVFNLSSEWFKTG